MESRYPVSQWSVKGIDLWPVVKKELFFSWFNTAHPSSVKVSSREKQGRFATYVSSFFSCLSFQFKKIPRSSFIFSGAASHRINFQDQLYNRYFDPMMDYIESSGDERPTLFEYAPLGNASNVYRVDRVVSLASVFPLFSFLVRRRVSGDFARAIGTLDQFDDFLAEVAAVFSAFKSSNFTKRLTGVLLNIYTWSLIFDWVFKKVKPAYAFGLCYYNSEMYGMNISAARNNVITIDMQHGGQGKLHASYGYFNAHPRPYNVLPRIFWCWESSSSENLERWTGHSYTVIKGGNPWLFQLTRKRKTDVVNINKKIILYTLQPLVPLLDDYIIEAIKMTPEEYEWWLRLHPRQLREKDDLIAMLKTHNILHRVNIDDATAYPLPLILLHCQAHISKSSGSVLEASLLGVNNIVIDPVGIAGYEAEITNGRATGFIERDAFQLLQLITMGKKQPMPRINNELFEKSILRFLSKASV